MKTKIALAVVMMAVLAGCNGNSLEQTGSIKIGNEIFRGLVLKSNDPLGYDAKTACIVQTDTCGTSAPQRIDGCYGLDQKEPGNQNGVLPQTRIVTVNNQGGPGWIHDAIKGVLPAAINAGGMMGAAALTPATKLSIGGTAP